MVGTWRALGENWIKTGRTWNIPNTKLGEIRGWNQSILAINRQNLDENWSLNVYWSLSSVYKIGVRDLAEIIQLLLAVFDRDPES